jgi:hypothetical protein
MQSTASSAIFCVGLSLLLSACESTPFAYAYCNQRKDTITIAEHRGSGSDRSSLEPRVRLFPMKSFPDRIEFFSPSGRQFAVFTLGDFKRLRDPNLPPMLVVSRGGVAFASRVLLDKMDREWEPAQHPSHPVSFSGGDGSSIDKAIIVHAQDDRDEGAGHYTYMREHFGYPWTYKGFRGGVTFTDDKIYDVYDFVTRDGRKHVLYFDTTRLRAGMVKRI